MAIQPPRFGLSREQLTERGSGVRATAAQLDFQPSASPIRTAGIADKLSKIADEMTANNDHLLIAENSSNFGLSLGEFQTQLDPDKYADWSKQVDDFSTNEIQKSLARARQSGVTEDGLAALEVSLKSQINTAKLAVMQNARSAEGIVTREHVTTTLNTIAQIAQGKGPGSREVNDAKQRAEELLGGTAGVLRSTEIVELRHGFNVRLEEDWLDALVLKSPHILMQLPDDAFRFTMRRDEYQAKARVEMAKVHKGHMNASGSSQVLAGQLSAVAVSNAINVAGDAMSQAQNHPEPRNAESISASITNSTRAFDSLAAQLATHRSRLTPGQINTAERALEGKEATVAGLEFKYKIAIAPDLESLKAVEGNLVKSLSAPGREGAQPGGQRVLRQFEAGLRADINDRRELLTDVRNLQDVIDNRNAYKLEEIDKLWDKVYDRLGINIATKMFTPEGNINEEVTGGVVDLATQLKFVDNRIVTYLLKTIQDRDPEKDNVRGNAVIIASLLKTAANSEDIDEAFRPVQDYLINSRSMPRVSTHVGADVRAALEVASGTSELGEAFLTRQINLMQSIDEIDDISGELGWSKQNDTLFKSLFKEFAGVGPILESTPGIKDRVLADYKYLTRTIHRNNPHLSSDDIKRRALDVVKNAYRVSYLLGKPQVMINPPESPRYRHGGIEATSEIQKDIFKTIKDFFNAEEGMWPEEVRKQANRLRIKGATLQTQEGASSALRLVQLTYAGVDENKKPQWRLSFMNRYIGLYRPEEREAKADINTVAAANTIQTLSNVSSLIKPGQIRTRPKWIMNLISELTGVERPQPSAEDLLGTSFETETVQSTFEPEEEWVPPTVRRADPAVPNIEAIPVDEMGEAILPTSGAQEAIEATPLSGEAIEATPLSGGEEVIRFKNPKGTDVVIPLEVIEKAIPADKFNQPLAIKEIESLSISIQEGSVAERSSSVRGKSKPAPVKVSVARKDLQLLIDMKKELVAQNKSREDYRDLQESIIKKYGTFARFAAVLGLKS